MNKKENWGYGFLFIAVSGLLCFVLSMTNSQINQMELGAMFNLVFPFLALIAGFIIYWIITLIGKKESWFTTSIFISTIITLYGFYLHFNA